MADCGPLHFVGSPAWSGRRSAGAGLFALRLRVASSLRDLDNATAPKKLAQGAHFRGGLGNGPEDSLKQNATGLGDKSTGGQDYFLRLFESTGKTATSLDLEPTSISAIVPVRRYRAGGLFSSARPKIPPLVRRAPPPRISGPVAKLPGRGAREGPPLGGDCRPAALRPVRPPVALAQAVGAVRAHAPEMGRRAARAWFRLVGELPARPRVSQAQHVWRELGGAWFVRAPKIQAAAFLPGAGLLAPGLWRRYMDRRGGGGAARVKVHASPAREQMRARPQLWRRAHLGGFCGGRPRGTRGRRQYGALQCRLLPGALPAVRAPAVGPGSPGRKRVRACVYWGSS